MGWGLDENIPKVYGDPVHTHHEGDSVFIFGFSSGNYAVLDVPGIIPQLSALETAPPILATYAREPAQTGGAVLSETLIEEVPMRFRTAFARAARLAGLN